MKVSEYFSNKVEEMPRWLKEYKKGNKLDFKEIMKSRFLFYPGSSIDGNPLGLINNSRFLHTYIYVDLGMKVSYIKEKLIDNNAFLGYDLLDIIDIKENDLISYKYIKHYHPSRDYIKSVNDWIKNTNADTFGIVAIYERKGDFDDSHGQKRFALIYLGADAAATYDALFINGYYHAPNIVYIQDNMGNESSSFSNGSPLETVAKMISDKPEYLLVYGIFSHAWDGYYRLFDVEPSFKEKNKIFLYKKI